MIKNIPSRKVSKTLQWSALPQTGHLVHYYKSDAQLIMPLTEYIAAGLRSGDSCVVIASGRHIQQLNFELLSLGLRLDEYRSKGSYLVLDALETLDKFMVNGMPDKKLFYENVGNKVSESIKNGTNIRAFGEMVALLWKVGNKAAVLRLEQIWNELAVEFDFSLYCAYPELHFVMDPAARQEISDCHTLHFPSLSLAYF